MYKQKITLGVRIEEDLEKRKVKLSEDFKNGYIKLQGELKCNIFPIREKTSRSYIKQVLKLFEDAIIEHMITLEKINGEAFVSMFTREQHFLGIYQGFIDDDKFETKVIGDYIMEEIKTIGIEKLNLQALESMNVISVYCSRLIKDIAYVTSNRNNKFDIFINVVLNYMLNSLHNLTSFANKEANDNIKIVLEYLINMAQHVYDLNENEDTTVEAVENKFIPKNLYSYKDLNRFAKDNGFEKVRDNGDHGVFRRFDGSTVVIPQGRDVGRGLSITLQKKMVSKEITTW